MTTFIDPKDFQGRQKIRILSGIVAAGKPCAPGEIIEVSSYEGYELICAGNAEPFVEAPSLRSL